MRRLVIDERLCQGHNLCFLVAPDLFDVDDLGVAHVSIAGPLDYEQELVARRAVVNCPERAIQFLDDRQAHP